MEVSVTIIATPAEDHDTFEEMSLEDRKRRSGGYETFPVRSGRALDTFVMQATGTDLSVFESSDEKVDKDGHAVQSCVITEDVVPDVVGRLVALVETNVDETARALRKHGGGTADPARVVEALRSGTWPSSGDAAEEAAAFAHQLLKYARFAEEDLIGLCWEYRGKIEP